MLAYVMVGTNDLQRSAKFYDAALAPLGLVRTGDSDRYFGYGPKSAPQEAQFYVTKPYDKKPATLGNGTMISLAAKSRRVVDEFHAAALASGGTDDGKPGPRPADGSNYVAYVRDPDGNKICAYCEKAMWVGLDNRLFPGRGGPQRADTDHTLGEKVHKVGPFRFLVGAKVTESCKGSGRVEVC